MILFFLILIFPIYTTEKIEPRYRNYKYHGDATSDPTYDSPLHFNIKHPQISDKWIQRIKPVKDVMYIWYPMSGKEGPKDVYIQATYNTTNKTVSAYGIPCGKLPSVSCMLDMLKVVIAHSRYRYFNTCSTTFPIPMLYNIPRWSIDILTSESSLYQTESFTLNSVILTSILLHFPNVYNKTCSDSMIPLYAIHNTLLNISVTRRELRKFFRKLPFLNIFKNGNVTIPSDSNDTQLITRDNLSAQKFYEIGSFMFAALYSTSDCRFRDEHNRKTIETNGVIEIHAGKLPIRNLLVNKTKKSHKNKGSPRSKQNKHIELHEIKHLDGMLLDYLDTLALHSDLTNITNVPIEHKRRSGSISFRGV